MELVHDFLSHLDVLVGLMLDLFLHLLGKVYDINRHLSFNYSTNLIVATRVNAFNTGVDLVDVHFLYYMLHLFYLFIWFN